MDITEEDKIRWQGLLEWDLEDSHQNHFLCLKGGKIAVVHFSVPLDKFTHFAVSKRPSNTVIWENLNQSQPPKEIKLWIAKHLALKNQMSPDFSLDELALAEEIMAGGQRG